MCVVNLCPVRCLLWAKSFVNAKICKQWRQHRSRAKPEPNARQTHLMFKFIRKVYYYENYYVLKLKIREERMANKAYVTMATINGEFNPLTDGKRTVHDKYFLWLRLLFQTPLILNQQDNKNRKQKTKAYSQKFWNFCYLQFAVNVIYSLTYVSYKTYFKIVKIPHNESLTTENWIIECVHFHAIKNKVKKPCCG